MSNTKSTATFGASSTDIKRVIALGFFDGVHIGHSALLRRTTEVAASIGAEPSVLSFDTHPGTVVSGRPVPLICDAAARVDLIKRLHGITGVIFVHFNEETMNMPWDVFVASMKNELGASHLIAGHDFRFGRGGEGNAEKLSAFCAENGMGCDIVQPVSLDGAVVSSTRIRALIADGDMPAANALLGHPHILLGTVETGYRLGRTLGTPTINMRFSENVIVPRFGVYATKVYYEGGERLAVTNIGVRPTVGAGQAITAESFGSVKDRPAITVESFLLDFEGDLYGHEVRVEFFEFLRPEIKFPNLDALKDQIQRDASSARAYFFPEVV